MSSIDTLDKATSLLGTCTKIVRLLAQGGATVEQLQGPIGSKAKRQNLLAFFAAVFRDSGGDLYVRCWYWGVGRWQSHYRWLDDDWGDDDPSALLGKVEPKV